LEKKENMMIFLWMIWYAQLLPSTDPAPNQPGDYADVMMMEAKEKGGIFFELVKGRQTDTLIAAEAALLKDSKPLLAKMLFEALLKTEPNNEGLKKGIRTFDDYLALLQDNYGKFGQKIAATNDESAYCSRAAILFHFGKVPSALNYLRSSAAEHGFQVRVPGLLRTLEMEYGIRARAREMAQERFQVALTKKNDEEILRKGMELYYLSMFEPDVAAVVKQMAQAIQTPFKGQDLLQVFEAFPQALKSYEFKEATP
jgi:hypothetical protein